MCKKQRMPWEPEPTPRIYVPPMGMYVRRCGGPTFKGADKLLRTGSPRQIRELKELLLQLIERRWSEVKADWLFLNAVGSYLGFQVDRDGVVEYTEPRQYGDTPKT